MGKVTPSSDIYTDPVCLMNINPEKKDIRFTYQGRTYYFCAETCREVFKTDPEKYLKQAPPAKRKGWWGRYLERLNKVTGGKPQKCCH